MFPRFEGFWKQICKTSKILFKKFYNELFRIHKLTKKNCKTLKYQFSLCKQLGMWFSTLGKRHSWHVLLKEEGNYSYSTRPLQYRAYPRELSSVVRIGLPKSVYARWSRNHRTSPKKICDV